MTHTVIREKFRKFFEDKGHKWVPSSSLLPDDPSVLFTTAGMQQFKKYYTGEADPSVFKLDDGSVAKGTVSIQKSMRTSDIDEVGDETHLTFFEMLGNFSFGGYKKKDAIEYAMTFLNTVMDISQDRIHVTYCGDIDAIGGPDVESKSILENNSFFQEIRSGSKEDNFWGPTGDEGPCGPTVEFYVDGVEIWNLVFNEFYLKKDKTWEPLKTFGIDTGMGLERLAMVSQGVSNIFETDLFKKLILPTEDKRRSRIIADHIRSITFLLTDGVRPSNKEQGYIIRRLIRRLLVHARQEFISSDIITNLIEKVVSEYKDFYSNLADKKKEIVQAFEKEAQIFEQTLENGLRELYRKYPGLQAHRMESGDKIEPFIIGQKIDPKDAFDLYQSYGFPKEVIKELAEEKLYEFDEKAFDEELEKHRELSRAGAGKKFGGHGRILDTGELKAADENELKIVTRLHTATHMLHAALRKVLGDEVHQAGSDITAERLRFDFTFPRKLTGEEIKKVEELVNQAIKDDLKVTKQEMPYEDAVKTGALSFFKLKYPPKVNVYSVGPNTVNDPSEIASGPPFSRELCGGPHVTHTGEIGQFKITKEEASSAGVRRIRAIVDERK